jgi:hypothetical protein
MTKREVIRWDFRTITYSREGFVDSIRDRRTGMISNASEEVLEYLGTFDINPDSIEQKEAFKNRDLYPALEVA